MKNGLNIQEIAEDEAIVSMNGDPAQA